MSWYYISRRKKKLRKRRKKHEVMKKRANYQMVAEDDPAFGRFWASYPKRVSKKDARKAWAELDPSPELVERMLDALTWQVQQPSWVKDGGQFVPYPASWLRAERYDDEMPAWMQPKKERPECPHVEMCGSQFRCHQLQQLDPNGQRWPVKRKGAA